MTKIIGIILCAIFLIIKADEAGKLVDVINFNGCSLKYTNANVHDKPEIVYTSQRRASPGVCRIQINQNESTDNYEKVEVKYYRNYRLGAIFSRLGPNLPDTIQEYAIDEVRTLNFDARTKSFMYLGKHIPYSQFIRRRLNDTQFVEKFVFKENYPLFFVHDKIEDFAYDWVTESLFISTRYVIAVVNLKNPSWPPAYLKRSSTLMPNFVIHPNAGYLFYTEKNEVNENGKFTPYAIGDAQSIIYRTYLDGSNKTQIGPISRHSWNTISSLTIDYHTDRLYWCAPDTNALTSSNLEGTDIKTVMHGCTPEDSDLESLRLISFDKKYIYYFSDGKSQIQRLDKNTFKKDENFGIATGTDIYQMLVYDPEAQKITSDNPCSIDNGGCEQYCFAIPNANATKGLQRKCVSPEW